jgi:hypothetical protein
MALLEKEGPDYANKMLVTVVGGFLEGLTLAAVGLRCSLIEGPLSQPRGGAPGTAPRQRGAAPRASCARAPARPPAACHPCAVRPAPAPAPA